MTPREEFDHLRALQRDTMLFEWSDEAPPGSSYYIRRRMIRRMAVLAAILFTTVSAAAHDSWISRGGYKNKVGEWCCGEGDCFVVPGKEINFTPKGYLLRGDELVPYSEAQPSPDGAYWRCKRPDGTRRCFFAPPPTQ